MSCQKLDFTTVFQFLKSCQKVKLKLSKLMRAVVCQDFVFTFILGVELFNYVVHGGKSARDLLGGIQVGDMASRQGGGGQSNPKDAMESKAGPTVVGAERKNFGFFACQVAGKCIFQSQEKYSLVNKSHLQLSVMPTSNP